MTNPATKYFMEAVKSRDLTAPLSSLAWHWWAHERRTILSEGWVTDRRVRPSFSLTTKVDFISLVAQQQIVAEAAECLLLEMLPNPAQLRRRIFESDAKRIEAILRSTIHVALVSRAESSALQSGQSVAMGASRPLGIERFEAAGIDLQDRRRPPAILVSQSIKIEPQPYFPFTPRQTACE